MKKNGYGQYLLQSGEEKVTASKCDASTPGMTPEGNAPKPVIVAAVSGGPDSVYLLLACSPREKGTRIVVGHVNYGTRGTDSEKDQELVEKIAKTMDMIRKFLCFLYGVVGRDSKGASGTRGNFPAGFEEKAREIRYRFLKDLSGKVGAEAIALAHTADDQVETILMRVFEGAGIGGLKGIPRETADGIVRPILDVWKEDILEYLKKRKIPYRIDRSNRRHPVRAELGAQRPPPPAGEAVRQGGEETDLHPRGEVPRTRRLPRRRGGQVDPAEREDGRPESASDPGRFVLSAGNGSPRCLPSCG